MRSAIRIRSVHLPALACVGLLVLAACGGGGGGGDGGGAAASSTLRGHVSRVDTAAASSETAAASASTAAGTIEAQGAVCAGISVRAERGGTVIATSQVDDDCDFEFRVPSGDVTLVFVAPGFTVSTVVVVPANSVLVIIVVLQPGGVIVEDREVRGTIHCEVGTLDISEPGENLVIDGEGEDCIRAGGNCTLTIEADHITLRNCEHCVRAEGGADVTVAAFDGDLTCEADADGVRTRGNATVLLSATDALSIIADEDGIDAGGTSAVIIDDAEVCRIEGFELSVRTGGNASIDTNGCTLVGDVGEGEDQDEDEDEDEDED